MKDSKNLVIGMLCAVVCIMAVAYAAFSTSLEINGTATISSNWGVRIGDTSSCTFKAVNAEEATTATACTGTETEGDNTMCASVVKTGSFLATISMRFMSPGDTATCTIPVENYGDLDAVLSYTVNGAAYDAETIDNDAVDFTVTGLDATLTAKTAGAIVVTGTYKDVKTQPTNDSNTIQIVVTAAQDK